MVMLCLSSQFTNKKLIIFYNDKQIQILCHPSNNFNLVTFFLILFTNYFFIIKDAISYYHYDEIIIEILLSSKWLFYNDIHSTTTSIIEILAYYYYYKKKKLREKKTTTIINHHYWPLLMAGVRESLLPCSGDVGQWHGSINRSSRPKLPKTHGDDTVAQLPVSD